MPPAGVTPARFARSVGETLDSIGLRSSPAWAAVSLLAIAATGTAHEALVVGLPEEIVFRGLVQGELERVTGRPAGAVLLAAAAFALAHCLAGQGAAGWLTFLPGCLFGALRVLSRSLWPSVAAHAIANGAWLAAS